MYLVRTEFRVAMGRAGEFEAGTTKLGEMRKGMSGYLGQTLLRSYSFPNKYVATSRWQNVESAWAFTTSELFASYARSAPAGVATFRRPGWNVATDDTLRGVTAPLSSTCATSDNGLGKRGPMPLA